MPVKWQVWYPHYIDAWQGSATIQELSDAAYRAYHNLIQAQYQSEDGMLPANEKELAKMSRMTSVWPKIREEVLGCLQAGPDNRVYSKKQFEEWTRTKDAHSKQRISAENTNRKLGRGRFASDDERSPTRSPTRSPAHNTIQYKYKDKDITNKSKRLTARKKREAVVDPRHTEFKTILGSYWQWARLGEMPWDASEAGKLGRLLKASPGLAAGAFKACVSNRHKSEGTTAERPRAWLESITKYSQGPLDRFGKLKVADGEGANANTAKARGKRNAETFREVLVASGDYPPGYFDSQAAGFSPEPGTAGRDLEGIPGRLPGPSDNPRDGDGGGGVAADAVRNEVLPAPSGDTPANRGTQRDGGGGGKAKAHGYCAGRTGGERCAGTRRHSRADCRVVPQARPEAVGGIATGRARLCRTGPRNAEFFRRSSSGQRIRAASGGGDSGMGKKAEPVILPPIGCDRCKGNTIGLTGYILVEKPGRPREVAPCECRLARDRAKRKAAQA